MSGIPVKQNIVIVSALCCVAMFASSGCSSSKTKTQSKPDVKSPPAPDQTRLKTIFDWPKPQLAIVISGEQNGYIEPCGCAGLENQKGGLSRRHTLLEALATKGWPLVVVDLGGLIRRTGPQAIMKYRAAIGGLQTMGYKAIGFSHTDLRLPATELMVDAWDEKSVFVSANMALAGFEQKKIPEFRMIEAGGRKVGVTAILGKTYQQEIGGGEIKFIKAKKALEDVLPKMKKECDFLVLLSHATMEESKALANQFPDFDLVVTAGGADEPPEEYTEINNRTLMVEVGHKGMYVGVLGLYDDKKTPIRYKIVPLDQRFKDTEAMKEVMIAYQQQLKDVGLEALVGLPMRHDSESKYIGSKACGECHTKAYRVWKETPHAKHATEHIVHPPQRLQPPRHHDPECLSCHVTGWEPQSYFLYEGGWTSLEKTPQMKNVGCENCHGPGSAHAEDEEDEELIKQMIISIKVAEEDTNQGCMKCHDLDNSPHFNFEEFWKEIVHKGKD